MCIFSSLGQKFSMSSEITLCSPMRLTPYLRSITTKERMNGLALVYMHKDIEVYVEECMDLFE